MYNDEELEAFKELMSNIAYKGNIYIKEFDQIGLEYAVLTDFLNPLTFGDNEFILDLFFTPIKHTLYYKLLNYPEFNETYKNYKEKRVKEILTQYNFKTESKSEIRMLLKDYYQAVFEKMINERVDRNRRHKP
jgi:hypothetical protein